MNAHLQVIYCKIIQNRLYFFFYYFIINQIIIFLCICTPKNKKIKNQDKNNLYDFRESHK